jgi:ADP-ribosyl-[dinitrogen reductase] hydrolase
MGVERAIWLMTDESIPAPADRYTGSLLGLAIGDALGMPARGRPARTPLTGYEPLRDATGEVQALAGQFTAHTELALCLVESLVSTNGFVDPDAAGYRFVQVLRAEHAHFLDPTTRAAIARAADTGEYQAGLAPDTPVEPGPAARIAPVALTHALGRVNTELFVREVLRATLITHASPEAVNGALAYAWALNLITRRETLPEMLLEEVLAFIDEDAVARALRVAAEAVRAGEQEVPAHLLADRSIGAAVATALFLFASAPDDITREVLRAANLPEPVDASAVAAMTGALHGAWLGARALPLSLVEGLEGRMYILMAAPALYRTAQRRAGLFLQLHQRP